MKKLIIVILFVLMANCLYAEYVNNISKEIIYANCRLYYDTSFYKCDNCGDTTIVICESGNLKYFKQNYETYSNNHKISINFEKYDLCDTCYAIFRRRNLKRFFKK